MGGGAVISRASAELKEFVHKVDAPVCDSLMGKGAFDGTNDLYTGMLGMHGTKTSNLGVSGVRSADRRRRTLFPTKYCLAMPRSLQKAGEDLTV